jgi:hypothetical protein
MYVPLTDDELEVLERLALAGEFKVVVKDWGHVTGFAPGRYDPRTFQGQPIVAFGDKRISFYFRMNFTAPVVPQPCWYFDMEVWALGVRLFPGRRRDEREPFPGRLPTETNGHPIQIAAGVFLDLALDVALDRIDPAVVKAVKPKASGLTTRHGNMHLDTHRQRLLAETQAGERMVREVSAHEAAVATAKQKKGTGR